MSLFCKAMGAHDLLTSVYCQWFLNYIKSRSCNWNLLLLFSSISFFTDTGNWLLYFTLEIQLRVYEMHTMAVLQKQNKTKNTPKKLRKAFIHWCLFPILHRTFNYAFLGGIPRGCRAVSEYVPWGWTRCWQFTLVWGWWEST